MSSSQSNANNKGKVRLSSKIIAAASNGDIDQLKLLVQEADELGGTDERNLYAALQRATRRGHTECACYLLDHGVKPDHPGDKGLSPLHRAIDSEISELVLLLLRHGADIEKRDPSGRTPLMSAASKSRNQIVKILLDYGADIEANSPNGRSVILYLAASPQSSNILSSTFKLLLDTGRVNLDQRDPVDKNALMWAVVRRNLVLANLVLSACDRANVKRLVRAVDFRGRSALHMAMEDSTPGVRSMVTLLLSSGAEVDGMCDGSLTPLAIASARGNYEAVDILLANGANVNSAINGDHDAADFGSKQDLNLNFANNISSPAAAGMTPLHWAAKNGHLKVITRLLACKETLANLRDDMFRSPLMQALESGHVDIARVLHRHLCETALSDKQRQACNEIMATIVDVKLKTEGRNYTSLHKQSIYEMVYEKSPNGDTLATTGSAHLKSRPDFRWIHLPANNVAWTEMLITKYFLEAGAHNISGLQACIHALHNQHREGLKLHSRHMEPLCKLFERVIEKRRLPDDDDSVLAQQHAKSEHQSETGGCQIEMSNVMLFPLMPYLHWEDCRTSQDMWTAINHGFVSRPASPPIDDLLISTYLHDSRSWHPRRTLDQSYHSSIDTERRDNDQVVSRYSQKRLKEGTTTRKPMVMMVNQLWLWILEDGLILTCAPQVSRSSEPDPLDLFRYCFQQLHTVGSGLPIRNVYDFGGLITSRCFGRFDFYSKASRDFRFLEIFEEAANELTNLEVDLFDAFSRASQHRSHSAGKTSSNGQDEIDSSLGEDEKAHSGDLLDVSAEILALRECKDLREELVMVESIFDAQYSIQNANQIFADAARHLGQADADTSFLSRNRDRPLQSLQDSQKLVERIAKQASVSHENLIQLLDLKQKQASVMEAAYTRSQSQETARQGKVIMVFTITTVVFLPISFLAAFFAINIEEFSRNGLNLSFVLKYTLGLGLATSLLLILVPLNMKRIKGITRKARAPKELGSPSTQFHHSDGLMGRSSKHGEEFEKAKHVVPSSSRLRHRWKGAFAVQTLSKEPDDVIQARSPDLEVV